MYEVLGWFGLDETAEESDAGGLMEAVGQLRRLLDENRWTNLVAQVHVLNGQHYLVVLGLFNRRREEAQFIDGVLDFVGQRLPGSWGLLYERDDEMSVPPGSHAFRVTVMTRGRLSRRLDPFLSPTIPTIED